MPGKHVAPGLLETINSVLHAIPPTNGWLLELGYMREDSGTPANDKAFSTKYSIYISGDTVFIPELAEVTKRLGGAGPDLMLVHLGGTSIPSPSFPLAMVTMDAKQGLQLMDLVKPDVTIPIHFDDYDVFGSSLADFRSEIRVAECRENVVYLARGDRYRFTSKQ